MKIIKPKPRSVLGLDIGQKRIGLAYSDALNITVSILPAVNRTKDFFELGTIKHFISIHNIRGIIAGLPLDEKGRMTNQAIDCKTYGDLVFNKLNKSIESIMEKINPQVNPYPSPYPYRH